MVDNCVRNPVTKNRNVQLMSFLITLTLTFVSFILQPLSLPVIQVPVSGRARPDEHPPGQHQRVLRAHHGHQQRLRFRQILRFQFWGEL